MAAYLVADVVARFAHSVLQAITDGHEFDLFVARPRRIIRLVIFLVAAAALLFPVLNVTGHTTHFGVTFEMLVAWLLDAGLRIAIICVAAYLAVRMGSAAARRFEREMGRDPGPRGVERLKRAQTLGRLLNKALSVLVLIIAGLMILRELNVDITPALTGAGILGLAVGFGSQTIVRDVLSGFFLMLEDQCRVGDAAIVNGQAGLVEEVNLRTIVLRDEEGTLHVFPNGEIKTLANRSKDFAYSVITFGIGYDEDPERVMAAMREAAAPMLQDPAYAADILEPLEVMGIDAFEAGQMVIKARIKTLPLKQATVGRELRRRIAATFAERGIAPPSAKTVLKVDSSQLHGAATADPVRR